MTLEIVAAGWRERLTDTPRGIRVSRYVIQPLGLCMWTTAHYWLVMPRLMSERVSLGQAIFAGAFFSFGMTVYFAVGRRRASVKTGVRGIHNEIVVARAFQTGEPPADTSLDTPLQAAIDRWRTTHQQRKAWALLPAAFGFLSLVFALVDANLYWLLVTGGYVAITVSMLRGKDGELINDQRDRLDRLELALRERQT